LSLLGQLPVRLTAEQAGWVLNCQPHDIPALIHARLLKPWGNPSANGTKYFATADLLEIAKDRSWLNRATAVINQHWRRQNGRKKDLRANGSENGRDLLAVRACNKISGRSMRREVVAVLLRFSSPLFRLSVAAFPGSWLGLLF
jgi:hypothetical protein